jgi:hypothetical protein
MSKIPGNHDLVQIFLGLRKPLNKRRILQRLALLTLLVFLLTACGYLCWEVLKLPKGRASRYIWGNPDLLFLSCIIFLPTLFAILRDDEKLGRTFLPNLSCPALLVILFYWPDSLRMVYSASVGPTSIGVGKSLVFLTWAFAWFQFLSFDRKPMARIGFGILCLYLSFCFLLAEAINTEANTDANRDGTMLLFFLVIQFGLLFIPIIELLRELIARISDKPAIDKEK